MLWKKFPRLLKGSVVYDFEFCFVFKCFEGHSTNISKVAEQQAAASINFFANNDKKKLWYESMKLSSTLSTPRLRHQIYPITPLLCEIFYTRTRDKFHSKLHWENLPAMLTWNQFNFPSINPLYLNSCKKISTLCTTKLSSLYLISTTWSHAIRYIVKYDIRQTSCLHINVRCNLMQDA